jgi:arylsulfatase
MADDLGFSDLGTYGGEIKTPNLDRLATEGVRFTRFLNTSRCCPSRVALLTGRYQHSVAMGWMTAVDEHRPGYRGQLADEFPTIAEIFKAGGYRTYMSGKWHVTLDPSYRVDDPKPNGSWPRERGFDEFYGGFGGGGGYYSRKWLMRNETRVTDFPDDYYYTHAITENALNFIEMHDAEKPLFLYIAHYAPHRPLEAPEERISRCRERYQAGFDVLRKERFERLKKLGFVEPDAELPMHEEDFANGRPSWDSLSKEKQQAWIEEMATYAAMVEIMDDGIGAVVDALKAKGIYENTLILFMSDNGATMEGGDISTWAADLSNTPFRMYKQYVHLGGIASPLILHFPKRFSHLSGTFVRKFSHIMDILPTSLEIAGLSYPTDFRGAEIGHPDGISLKPALRGENLPERDLFFEHQTASSIISGDLKLVRRHKNADWKLYDLSKDPFEEDDLSSKMPSKKTELEEKWTAWAKENNVFPLESRPWHERINYYRGIQPD